MIGGSGIKSRIVGWLDSQTWLANFRFVFLALAIVVLGTLFGMALIYRHQFIQ
jgi:hypothetical protein